MKIAAICFTKNGLKIAKRIKTYGKSEGDEISIYAKSKYIHSEEEMSRVIQTVEGSLKEWVTSVWSESEALVFIGATGIAVRAIAPFVKDKLSDPAVIVIDEQGNYCISLLSGHLGGGNALAQRLSVSIDAEPVVTTATDLNECFALDVSAQEQGWQILDRKKVKEFSAALLAGESVITLGIGCRKGAAHAQIEKAVKVVCEKYRIPMQSIAIAASIDLKKEEAGIRSFCIEKGIPFVTYSMEQLREQKGIFTESEFVQKITGVDNVCERSALAATRDGLLIVRKQSIDGVTVAMAIENGGMINE